jgi:hypothetical protein
VRLDDPRAGTRVQVGDLFERGLPLGELLAGLTNLGLAVQER